MAEENPRLGVSEAQTSGGTVSRKLVKQEPDFSPSGLEQENTPELRQEPLTRSLSWRPFALRKRRKRRFSESSEGDVDVCLENIITSSRLMAEKAEVFVKKVIEAGWNLVHHHALPDWLQDNEHLVQGHRPPTNSFRACFKSIFRIHTETGNIWTHLIGMLMFILVFVYTLNSRYLEFMWQDITVHSVFYTGIILCLGFSFLFHTVFCHSEGVNKLFGKLDYCGISLLIVGSSVPWFYYSFYCQLQTYVIYTTSISVLGLACIVISLWDKFATPEYRALRAGLFIGLGLTGAIPVTHFVLTYGLKHAFFDCGLGWAVLMAVLYITGALIYAMRIPECLFPGKFDIWFQSHQIFHVFVVLAAFAHVQGLEAISTYRLENGDCPVAS